MTKTPSSIKKLVMIIVCIVTLIGVYYMLCIKPFDEVWEEGKAVYSGKSQPKNDHPLWSRYRLDWGEPYSLATEVKLDAKRSFVWRWGKHGRMMVNYTQEYYDINGNLLRKINGGDEWILEKKDGKWQIVDINVPNL